MTILPALVMLGYANKIAARAPAFAVRAYAVLAIPRLDCAALIMVLAYTWRYLPIGPASYWRASRWPRSSFAWRCRARPGVLTLVGFGARDRARDAPVRTLVAVSFGIDEPGGHAPSRVPRALRRPSQAIARYHFERCWASLR